MANRKVNSLLQWDDLEEVERRQYERNRRLREEEETPLENDIEGDDDECDFDNAHT